MNRIYVFIFAFCLASLGLKAQQIPQTFSGRTHMLSKDELKNMKDVGKDFVETAPPIGEVRNIAEFERTEGIIIGQNNSNSFGVPMSLITEISETTIVYMVATSTAVQQNITNLFTSNNVNMDNVVFVDTDTDSYWARDYSPWFIANNNEVAIVDFPYNRPRPQDDELPIFFGSEFGLDVYGMNLVSTGGNYMTDGMGVAASCDLVYQENPALSEADVDNLVKDYLGINTYHLVRDPLAAYIEHIDCWGKFLDVDKILITKVPDDDPRYADFEAMADYWANQESSYGNKYQVYRTYSPNGQPYTNSLILNDKVFVPIIPSGGSYNDDALDVYQQAMPGYEIIGFEPFSDAPWQGTDALHCRTHEVPDMEMLYLKHFAVLDTLSETTSEVTIDVEAVSYGGHDIESVKLFYKVSDQSDFSSVDMIASTKGNTYQTIIDNLSPSDSVAYYIQASDASGRVEKHPFIGSGDPHKFYIDNKTGVYEKVNLPNISIYPNPVRDLATVILKRAVSEDLANIIITDINGKVVITKQIHINSDWERITLNASELKQGVYFVTIKNSNFTVTKKMLKQ